MTKAKMLDVFHIKPPRQEGSKSHWTKVGIAFENRDGSLNVILDYVPAGSTDGKFGLSLHIREQKPKENYENENLHAE